MKLDGKKPSLADMFDSAEARAKSSRDHDKKTEKPKFEFSGRPTGGLKPNGFKAKAEINF